MYMNTSYKAFVAEAAAKVAAEISKSFTAPEGEISRLKEDTYGEMIAIAAVNVAEHLALKLEEFWRCKGDKKTVFFDVDDTLLTRVEGAIYDVAEKLQETSDSLIKIKEALTDKENIYQYPVHLIAESIHKMQWDKPVSRTVED